MVHASDASAKIVLRLQVRDLRRELARKTPDAAEQAVAHLPTTLLAKAKIVAGYRPQGAEIDPWPLMAAFAKAGARLALPAALGLDAPLVFRAYADGDRLEPDAVGIPAPTNDAPIVEPDLVITPLLAFDRPGARMGQGGGHYDRTLDAMRARGPVFVLGLAYAGQQVARIPAEPHDQPLDAILTEKEYIEVAKDL
jgi:5-formyltetrahydrofolate cyclo-ligase